MLLDQIQNPDFWRELNPALSISDGSQKQLDEKLILESEEVNTLLNSLHQEGYFQLDSLLPEEEMFTMALAAATLEQTGIPPTFAFVYDEFWQTLQRLSVILSAVLGEGYQQLPGFWVWCIDTDRDQAGWQPHRDRSQNALREDGTPKLVTVWIPLTDAVPLNGCMYILPASLDPEYGKSTSAESPVPMSAMTMPYTQLQNIRALPATAGSVLGWNQAVLHWGGRSSDIAPHPRISFSCEFQRCDVKPFSPLLLNPHDLPSFKQRLALISVQILQYQHMYPLPEELAEIATELKQSIPAVFEYAPTHAN